MVYTFFIHFFIFPSGSGSSLFFVYHFRRTFVWNMAKAGSGKSSWLRWCPAILWMAVIFILSGYKGQSSGNTSKWVLDLLAHIGLDLQGWFGDTAHFLVRKAAHFTEYFILSLLLFFALKGKNRRGYLTGGIAVLYAITDEIHQSLIPGRSGNVRDVLIDTGGVLLALMLLAMAKLVFKKQND